MLCTERVEIMRKKGMRFALLLAAVLAVLMLSGCADRSTHLENKMKQEITMDDCRVEEDALTGLTMTVTVTTPDYSAYMLQYMAQAEETAKDENDFERTLYELVLDAVADAPQSCTREVTVNLSALNEKKAQADWSEKELLSAAQQAAFDAEVEEFCLGLLVSSYPADFNPDETTESGADAQ